MLYLQRQYGNRYVQRMLANSGRGVTSSSVRANASAIVITQAIPRQVSRQGLLSAAEETAAINFSRRYDERSIRIIQIITGANVDGRFGNATAEANRSRGEGRLSGATCASRQRAAAPASATA